MATAPRPRATPLRKTSTGALVSAKSKTGNPMCSQAMSAWKTSGMTPAVAAVLGKCRAMAYQKKRARGARAAGNEARAQHWEHNAERGLSMKERAALAKRLKADLAAKRVAQAAQATAAKPVEGPAPARQYRTLTPKSDAEVQAYRDGLRLRAAQQAREARKQASPARARAMLAQRKAERDYNRAVRDADKGRGVHPALQAPKPAPAPPAGMVQRRAAMGGEIGPNGLFYPAGSFIATANNPKLDKASRTGSGMGETPAAQQGRQAKYYESRRGSERKRGTGREEIEPGKWEKPANKLRAIYPQIAGVAGRMGPDGVFRVTMNEGTRQYLGEKHAKELEQLAARYNQGERFAEAIPQARANRALRRLADYHKRPDTKRRLDLIRQIAKGQKPEGLPKFSPLAAAVAGGKPVTVADAPNPKSKSKAKVPRGGDVATLAAQGHGPDEIQRIQRGQAAAKGSGARAGSYDEAVAFNLGYMGTPAHEWTAVPVKGMAETDTPGGRGMMPEFAFPAGYGQAKSWFKDSGENSCCGLCGAGIKNVFWLQNDKQQLTLPVGSECVTRFGEGQSGEKLARKTVQSAHRELARSALGTLEQLKSEAKTGYLGNRAAGLIRKLEAATKVTPYPVRDYQKGWSQSNDAVVTKWAKAKGDEARDLMRQAQELMAAPEWRREALHGVEREITYRRSEMESRKATRLNDRGYYKTRELSDADVKRIETRDIPRLQQQRVAILARGVAIDKPTPKSIKPLRQAARANRPVRTAVVVKTSRRPG